MKFSLMKRPSQLLLLIFLCTSQLCLGQSAYVDSLKLVLETAPADTNKVNTLIAICVSEYRSSPADAIVYGNEARVLSEKLGYNQGLALAYKYIGMGHYFQGPGIIPLIVIDSSNVVKDVGNSYFIIGSFKGGKRLLPLIDRFPVIALEIMAHPDVFVCQGQSFVVSQLFGEDPGLIAINYGIRRG